MDVVDEGGEKGRGYVAKEALQPGTVLLAESPHVLDNTESDFAAVAAVHAVAMDLRAKLNRAAPAEESGIATKFLRRVEGLTEKDVVKAFAQAENNGFRTTLSGVAEAKATLLFNELSIFNHSCVPNCCSYLDERTGHTRVLVTQPVAKGAELTIHYSDELLLMPTELRRRFMVCGLGFRSTSVSIVQWNSSNPILEDIVQLSSPPEQRKHFLHSHAG